MRSLAISTFLCPTAISSGVSPAALRPSSLTPAVAINVFGRRRVVRVKRVVKRGVLSLVQRVQVGARLNDEDDEVRIVLQDRPVERGFARAVEGREVCVILHEGLATPVFPLVSASWSGVSPRELLRSKSKRGAVIR